MTDRIATGVDALESVPVDVGWDDVASRIDAGRAPGRADASSEEQRTTEVVPLAPPERPGRRAASAPLRLAVATAVAAVLVLVVVIGTRSADGANRVATRPPAPGTTSEPAPTPNEATREPVSTTPAPLSHDAKEQIRQELLRTKLHGELITYLGDRYGRSRPDGDDLVVLVVGPTPADQAWLDERDPNGSIRLEPTENSQAELDRAQAVVNAELVAWGILPFSTGQPIDRYELSVLVFGHHEGLEARLRELVDVPLSYTETDEPFGFLGVDAVAPDGE